MILKKNTIKEQWLTGGSDPVTAKVDAARYKGILHVNFFGGPKNNNICLSGECSGKVNEPSQENALGKPPWSVL